MNRGSRRALNKKVRDEGFRAVLENVLDGLGGVPDGVVHDGDLVTLNTDKIMGRRDYPRMQERYRRFVEENRGRVFTAHLYRSKSDGFPTLVELDGVEPWLFWFEDLIKVHQEDK